MSSLREALTRRQFLRLAGATVGAATLAACAPTTTPVPTAEAPEATEAPAEEPAVEEEVEPTQIPERAAAAGRATNIEIFEVWGGAYFDGWVNTAMAYEESHPDVGVKITYAPGHGDNPKLLTSVAGGVPPDIAMIVDFSTAQWAELGVMTPLTPYFEAAGLKGEDFWKAAWYLMEYEGEVWQMPFDVDPNFPNFWNKGLFEECGLDPEVGPTTITDVNEFSKAINKVEDGVCTRIGMVPWGTYGFGNSIYTWGWAFGGNFFDAGKQEVTPDDEYVVAALEWMSKYAQDLGGPDAVSVTPPGLQVHSFGGGNIGMAPMVTANYLDILKYSPDMKIGHGLLPYEGPGESDPGAGAWISGWRLFMPVGAQNPEAAWDFMNWYCATPEGTQVEWDTIGFPPGWKASPVYEEFKADSALQAYYNVLETAKHAKDPVPVGAFYQAQLEEMAAEAVYGRMTATEAMVEAKNRTMAEWDRFREEQG